MHEETQGQFRASVRTWKKRVSCGQNGPNIGAGCSSNVRHDRSRPRLCQCSDGCAGERPRRRPATSRCGWHGTDRPAGCARAGHGHFRPSGPLRSTPRLGGFADKARSTPSARWPWLPRNSRVRPTPARRPFRPAKASRSKAGEFRLFFEPPGNGLPRHAEDALGRTQTQALDLHRPQHHRLACGIGRRAFGHQHPVCPARLAEILLGAAGVVATFDEGRALARSTAGSRGFHTHPSPKKPALSLDQLPLPPFSVLMLLSSVQVVSYSLLQIALALE